MSATIRLAAIGLAAGIGFGLAPAHAQVLTEKNVSAPMALSIAHAALASCEKSGYRVSVTVVDRAGMVKLQLRGDGANPHTFENSFRKAYTAKTVRVSSAEFTKRFNDPANSNARAQATLPNFVALAGALPIKVGDDVIGAVGVSGAPGGEKDEVCAQAGIDTVGDQLK
jgi:uncharacterized protein GlcG (DUF336 family)